MNWCLVISFKFELNLLIKESCIIFYILIYQMDYLKRQIFIFKFSKWLPIIIDLIDQSSSFFVEY